MEYSRTYTHRTFGEIGKVTITAPDGEWLIDGKALSAESIMHLLGYASQSLQDAYAGAKTQAEAKGAFDAKMDKIVNGTIGTRGDGSGASFETIVARSVMRNAAKLKFGKDSAEWAKFTGLPDADQIAKLDEWLAGKAGESLKGAIAKEVELRKARAANKAEAANGLDISL